MKKYLLHCIAASGLLIAISLGVGAQPVLDNTFSGDGYLISKVSPSGSDIARTVVIQPNGRILTGGNSFNMIGASNIYIVRTKPNGVLDNTFGTGGIATIAGGFFCDMTLLPTGKIIVAGSGVGPTNNNNYIVYRLNKNGSLDNTFGTGGSVQVNMPYQNMICYDVALQPDGKIVLAGYADDGAGGHHNMIVVRLNSNGKLDKTFASGGKFTLTQPGKGSECRQIAIQSDGKIVGGGFIDTLLYYALFKYDFAAIRLNVNGTLDNSFGVYGVVRADKGATDIASSVAILSDGRIVLGGNSDYYTNGRFTTLCLLSNGVKDISYGTEGWSFIDVYGGSAWCNAMALEPDDDLILAGDTYFAGGYHSIAMAKILSDGTPDMMFGDAGKDTSFYALIMQGCNDVALQADNKIVVAGYQYQGDKGAYLIARYTNSITLMKQASEIASDELTIYPNPLIGNSISVSYTISEKADIQFRLLDMNGNQVVDIQKGIMDAGSYSEIFAIPESLPSGVYLFELTRSGIRTTTRLIVAR